MWDRRSNKDSLLSGVLWSAIKMSENDNYVRVRH